MLSLAGQGLYVNWQSSDAPPVVNTIILMSQHDMHSINERPAHNRGGKQCEVRPFGEQSAPTAIISGLFLALVQILQSSPIHQSALTTCLGLASQLRLSSSC